jgi:hypothetical protein
MKKYMYWICLLCISLILIFVCIQIKFATPEEQQKKAYNSIGSVRSFYNAHREELQSIADMALNTSEDFAAAGWHGEVIRNADGFEDTVLKLLAMRSGPTMMKEKENRVSFYFHCKYRILELSYSLSNPISKTKTLAALGNGWYISYGY